ncbi:MAG: type II toxin-antitoxin system RelB/DinJ family antitoxin [Clostridiales Family XIII bacterium]|jgi:DNA-damage-inducible protein J|nr:type II toxin-antitoxin system RelB/DinJ family antitoxin [Clostridiales Family XIII bacterium]
MAGVTNLNIKIDRDLKAQADRLFSDMGMNLTTAVNVFVRQAVLEKAIPFKIYRSVDSAGTAANSGQRQAAMQEIRELLSGIEGESIDLNRMRAERRTARFERND